MRFQKKDPNRQRLYSGVSQRIKERINNLAIQHNCSKSFVTNTLLAKVLNISIEEHYNDYPKIVRKAKRSA